MFLMRCSLAHYAIVEKYCSSDPIDIKFLGAVGYWYDISASVLRSVGLPPFEEDLLLRLVNAVNEEIKCGNPCCRVLVLPYRKESALYKAMTDETLGGEIVAYLISRSLRI